MDRAWKNRFLVDVWAEGRGAPELPAVVRARIRVVGLDEEHYVGSFEEIASVIEARLDADGIVPRRWQRP